MRRRQTAQAGLALMAALTVVAPGCFTPSAHTTSRNYGLRPEVPVDPPGTHNCTDEDADAGARLFKMYCGSCHNARPLGERPFSNYEVAVAHMRDQAYLTGKEYRAIILFLRRWHDVGPATPSVDPSPKRLIFSQPIAELRGEAAGASPALPPLPSGAGPWRQPGAAP